MRRCWSADRCSYRPQSGSKIPPGLDSSFFSQSAIAEIAPKLSPNSFHRIVTGREWRWWTRTFEWQPEGVHFTSGSLPIGLASEEDAENRIVRANATPGLTSAHNTRRYESVAANDARKAKAAPQADVSSEGKAATASAKSMFAAM